MNKAIFLDRDGVIIEDLKYNCNINNIVINNEIIPILKQLQTKFLLIIITNQSGVARGYFKLNEVYNFHKHLIKILKDLDIHICDIFVCPHYVRGTIKKYSIDCDCRKPKIGLIMSARQKYNIDLSKSYLIGDKQSDILCGENAKLKRSFNITMQSPKEILKQIDMN